MKNFKTLTVGMLVVALTAAVPGLAQKGPEKKPMMHQEMLCQSELNLSDQQEEELQKMRLDFQKEMLPLKTELQTKMLELRQLRLENAETNKINAKIDEIARTRAEIQKKAYAHHLEVRKILTEEQKRIFDNMGAHFGTHMGSGHMSFGWSMGCMGSHHGHRAMGPEKEKGHTSDCQEKHRRKLDS